MMQYYTCSKQYFKALCLPAATLTCSFKNIVMILYLYLHQLSTVTQILLIITKKHLFAVYSTNSKYVNNKNILLVKILPPTFAAN